MIPPSISEFFKRLFTGLILLGCFGGAYLHSTMLFSLFLAGVLFFMITTEWPKVIALPTVPWMIVTAIYPGLFMGTLIWLTITFRTTDFYLPLYPFFVAWTADTFGYLIGTVWGNHKIYPPISPGKSWEGLAGSFAGVLVMHLLLLPRIALFALLNTFLWTVFLSITMTLIAFLGGFWLSFLKRRQGLKDAGHLLPGHGGLLDRFDSVMFVGVATAIMTILLR